jgi:hypothetical protein
LIKNSRIKCTVLIFPPGRICNADFDLFPGSSVPLGAVSLGNFMEDEEEKNRTAGNSPLDPLALQGREQ